MRAASIAAPTILAATLALSLGACGASSGSSNQDQGQSSEPEAAQKAPESSVAVTIDGVTTTTDYEGKPCAVVSYTFTNVSSDEARAFSTSTYQEVYQGGVQCDVTMATDGSADGQSSLTKVKAGNSVSVKIAYELKDNSDLEVNVYPMDFSGNPLASKTFTLS